VHVGTRMNDTRPVKGRLRRSATIQGSFAQSVKQITGAVVRVNTHLSG
jgi:hypothetical protein